MKTSEQVNEYVAAMVVAQRQFGAAKKDSLNPHFGSKYDNLGVLLFFGLVAFGLWPLACSPGVRRCGCLCLYRRP